MKVLLDKCLPKKLKRDFVVGYEVNTVPEMGWAGIKNGALLNLAEPNFDVFITIDNNLRSQQNLKTIQFTLNTKTTKL
jgi:predicted nuclease of predicted toxin-antitoxin system